MGLGETENARGRGMFHEMSRANALVHWNPCLRADVEVSQQAGNRDSRSPSGAQAGPAGRDAVKNAGAGHIGRPQAHWGASADIGLIRSKAPTTATGLPSLY